jgi:eukaryotic-like serine/threonine-protein kinase
VAASRAATFAENAVHSGLVTAKQVRACWRELSARGSEPGDKALAGRMVSQGLLTQYQAERLLAGRNTGFFLEKYKILDHIASGGMGEVYRAEHTMLGRVVALKVLPRKRAAKQTALERFQREGRALARLDHPNIVRTYDVGHERDLHFLIMEYVDGKPLWRLVRNQGRVPWRQTVDIITQVVRGLEHAWAQGIVHRDIKPGNVLVTADGQAKVLDMGLAHLFDEPEQQADSSSSVKRFAVGTGDYMAPEQVLGQDHVDHRTDIYSLGCMMYFMLSGGPPFEGGSTLEKLERHRNVRARPVQELTPDVPDRVAAILRRMMSKRPDHRYNEAKELLADLTGSVAVRVPEDDWLAHRREALKKRRQYVFVPWTWHLRWLAPTFVCVATLAAIVVLVVMG